MLQAESSCARDLRTSDLSAVNPQGKISKQTVYKVNHKRKIFIKIGLALFAYALLLVYLCIKSATLGYQIEKLELDNQSLDTVNHRLEYEIAQKSSLARVEKVASADLGMYKPDNQTSIAMEVEQEPAQIATDPAAAADDQSISQNILKKMYNSLSHLAQNN